MEKSKERKADARHDFVKRIMGRNKLEPTRKIEKIYLCKCGKKLSEEEIKDIAAELQCNIGLVGKVLGQERWDYRIDGKNLTYQDRAALMEYGLEILF